MLSRLQPHSLEKERMYFLAPLEAPPSVSLIIYEPCTSALPQNRANRKQDTFLITNSGGLEIQPKIQRYDLLYFPVVQAVRKTIF